MPTSDEWDALDEAAQCLDRALGVIGEPDKTDHDLAKIIVDNELKLRGLVNFILTESTLAASK